MSQPPQPPPDASFDPDPGLEDEPPPIPPQALIAAVALLAAAALAVFAPFQALYTVGTELKQDGRSVTFELAVDGWGRYDTAVPSASHGIRFGVVAIVCAGLFLVLAATVAAAAVDPSTWAPRLGAVLAATIAVTAAVAALVGVALLSVEIVPDSFARLFQVPDSSVSTSPGWFVWALCGVVVFGAAGAVALRQLAQSVATGVPSSQASTSSTAPA